MEVNIDKIRKEKPIKDLLEFSIINIDKPSGPTSFGVDLIVKQALNLNKTSHFGTLDPMVTGVLPVALERACRLMPYFIGKTKTYVGVMRIHKDISENELKKQMKEFIGIINQLPPVKSRVKRQIRERQVYSFEILEINEDGKDVLFKAEVQAGTYIRKLCLHPNTEIITPSNIIKIKEFYLNPSIVYSYDDGKIELKKPSETQKIPTSNKLIKLKMSSGIEILTTPDHKMLASKDKMYEMIESEKLKVGDYLVKAYSLPTPTKDYIIADLLDDNYLIEDNIIKEECKKALIEKYGSIRGMNKKLKLDRKAFLKNSKYSISIKHLKLAGIYERVKNRINNFKTQKGNIIQIDKLNNNHFYLLGLIASDGNNTKEKNTKRFTRLKFHNEKEVLVDKFIELYKELFPTIAISKKKVKPNLFQVDTSNSLFATLAANLGIVSPNKYSDILPILYCKDKFIKSFLMGYFDGDGGAYIKKKNNSTTTYSRVCFFSVNCTNAKRIHQMLLKLNINSKILKNKKGIYIIDINCLPSKKQFIKEIGTNHPRKKEIFEEINKINHNGLIGDENYIGFHYKNIIRENKSKLSKMGGNLQRVLVANIPITKGFYRKCSEIINLQELDNFIIERIDNMEIINSVEKDVFDMTIPETHNFLIETGFVSSNCSDLGEKIGGAHMLELRRIKASIFEEKNSHTLFEVLEAIEEYIKGDEKNLRDILIPGEIISQVLPVIEISDKTYINKLYHGSPLFKERVDKKYHAIEIGDKIAVFNKDKFIGVFNIINHAQILAMPEFIMQPLPLPKKI